MENISFFRKGFFIKIFIVLTTIALIALMFPQGETIDFEVAVGSVWMRDDLIAPYTFPVLKDKDIYALEKAEAAKKVLPIFVVETNASKIAFDSLNKIESLLSELEKKYNIDEDLEKELFFLKEGSRKYFLNYVKLKRKPNNGKILNYKKVIQKVRNIIIKVYQKGVINVSKSIASYSEISVRTNLSQSAESLKNFYTIEEAQELCLISLYTEFGSNSPEAEFGMELFNLVIKPSIIYSKELTDEEIKIAQEKISPNIGIVKENERIVAKHERITPEIKLKIDSYKAAKGTIIPDYYYYVQYLGKLTHIAIIFSILGLYIYLFRKRIYYDNQKILLILMLILIISGLCFFLSNIKINAPIHYFTILPAASMILTIVFDSRIGFYGSVIMSLILGGLRGNDYTFAMMNIIAGAFAAYTVRDIKNRTQIFRSFGFIFLGYASCIFAFGLERFENYENLLIEGAFAASNAFLSPIFAYGMTIFVERIFGITTDLTLFELTDFNRPLLKELAQKAPGTFSHSLTIGSMVESAAEAIGANPLLARVGAYYHDIGKLVNPPVFIENIGANNSLHIEIDPKESAKLIIQHISNGLELGKKYKLPKEVLDFIPMHHGTLLITYFYEKAKEKYGENNVDEKDFRYPGPKPNSKETALVMLADACESASRSIEDDDPKKLENLISNLIKQRLDDKQLEESNLTLSEIEKIKNIFISTLASQKHKRIRYPNQEKLENLSENGRNT